MTAPDRRICECGEKKARYEARCKACATVRPCDPFPDYYPSVRSSDKQWEELLRLLEKTAGKLAMVHYARIASQVYEARRARLERVGEQS